MKTPATPLTLPADHVINRELALLQFQRRVLSQAADPDTPLLERLRFLCIVSSNLDEFFEIRFASIKEQLRIGAHSPTHDNLSPTELLPRLRTKVHTLIKEQYSLLHDDILPALAQQGIIILRRDEWNDTQREWIREYFCREVMPILTPIGLDPAHPFPRVLNKSLNFAVELAGQDAFGRNSRTAIVQAPRTLPRIIWLPPSIGTVEHTAVLLSSILHDQIGTLFSGMEICGCYQFRVTRNSDLFVDEEEVKDLRATLKGELQQRHFGDAVRLEIADNCSDSMAAFLLKQFSLKDNDLYRVPGMVNLVRLMSIPDHIDRPDLKFPPFSPRIPKELEKEAGILDAIAKQDILLHHPFQSFKPIIDLLRTGADDPSVVAIKMSIYRTGTDSVLMEHLVRAAHKGKEVTVILELMARFDEEANLSWAHRLEEAGAHVVYGVFGYKTHAKLLMLIRREKQGLRRYVHLGTGNYHPRTTRFYTDFGLLTADEKIGEDVAEVFKQLTALGTVKPLNLLWQAPFSLHSNVINAIEHETDIARHGGKGRIIAKMNALLEPQVIQALYSASQAGVEIDLIVRGACALRPGVTGLSESIRVRSIIGRFLEHHRIYYFHANGEGKLYLSSADWMDRNFFRRIEVAFPVLNLKLKRRILREGLRVYLRDNTQAWDMQSDGTYRRKNPRTAPFSAQQTLLEKLAARK